MTNGHRPGRGRRRGILIISIAIATAACLLTSGCSLVWPDNPSSGSSSPSAPSKDYSAEYGSGWCYQRLAPHLRDGYS